MSEHMRIFTDTQWTLVGFVIFMTLFALFVGSTYLPSQKRLHDRLSRLPLEDDKQGERA